MGQFLICSLSGAVFLSQTEKCKGPVIAYGRWGLQNGRGKLSFRHTKEGKRRTSFSNADGGEGHTKF